ncbi:hypothetical protein SDC9_169019 [bioreactor metagenome]|uniref:Uncharacterized protein n=1 Tax=bioreactor metagenome TaxID=1076179 RepID=A0A645G767_9ZZZZ
MVTLVLYRLPAVAVALVGIHKLVWVDIRAMVAVAVALLL